MKSLITITALLLVFNSCKRSDHLVSASKTIITESFSMELPSDFYLVKEEGMSTSSGTITNDKLSFRYSSSSSSSQFSYYGLVSLKEASIQSFKGYYHQKFFDALHVEKRLQKIFIDSIEFIEVLPINFNNEFITECSTCNVQMNLKFKKNTFYFPLTISEDVLRNYEAFNIIKIDIDENVSKVIHWPKGKKNNNAGAFIKMKTAEDKKGIKITTTNYNHGSHDLILNALKTIRLK